MEPFNCLLTSKGHTLDHDGLISRYIVRGDGTPIVLLPGTGGDEKIFCRIIPALAESFKVFSISHHHQRSVEKAIEGLHAIFSKHIGEPFHLLGTSVGGRLAQYYTEKYPEDVLSLILGNTYVENESIRRGNKLNQFLIKIAPYSMIANILIKGTKKNMQGRPGSDIFIEYFTKHVKENTKAELLARVQWNFEKLPLPQLPKKLSKLLFISADDPLIPLSSRDYIKQYYPEATVHEFATGGHFPYYTDAAEYAQILLSFLDKQ